MRRAECTRPLALLACLLAACAGWPGPEPEPAAAEPAPALIFDPPSDLPAPGGLAATGGLYRQVPLQWDPVLRANVAGYLVESAPELEGRFRSRAILRSRGALAWVDRGEPDDPLLDGQTRYYRLRSFADDGRVSDLASDPVLATTAPPADPPDGLRAFSLQPRSIPLVWQASLHPGVVGYTVERSPSPDGPFEVVAEPEGRHTTHVLDAGLGDLRVFHYRVYSRNAAGEIGPPSPVLRAVTKPAPLPPVGLRVQSQRLGAIELSWEPNVETDLQAYRLLRWRGELGPETVTYVGAMRVAAEDAGVGAGEAVSYALVAVDLDGLESRPSERVHAQATGYEVRGTAGPGGVRLAWEPRDDEGFVGARITRTSWPWGRRDWKIAGAELLDREVSPGRNYEYVIQLEHGDGRTAPPSQPVAVEVPEAGGEFVEIQPPTPRIHRPDGVPR